MTDTVNILDMNEDELLAQFKARDSLIESLRQQLAEEEKRFSEHFTASETSITRSVKALRECRQQLAECQAECEEQAQNLAEQKRLTDLVYRREKVLRDALEQWDRLIDHQFTGSSEAMTALQQAADTGADALALPSDSGEEK
jgi:hypothetical protein